MNTNQHIAASQNGYSMIEILVAMLIVPFGLLGVAKFQSNIMVVGAETKTRTEALYAAEEKIEDLRTFANSIAYNNINSGSDTVTAKPGTNAALARSWTVTDASAPNYKTITVDVNWASSDNQSRSVSLTSYVSQADPVASGKLVLADSLPVPVSPPAPNPSPNPDPQPDPQPDPNPSPNPDPSPDPLPDPGPTTEPVPTSYSITVSGFINYLGNGNNTWSVTVDGSICATGSNSGSYNCVIPGVPVGDAPTLVVSISSAGTICGTDSASKPFSSSSNFGTQDFVHAQNANRC